MVFFVVVVVVVVGGFFFFLHIVMFYTYGYVLYILSQATSVSQTSNKVQLTLFSMYLVLDIGLLFK